MMISLSVTAQKKVYFDEDLNEVPTTSSEKRYYSEYDFLEVNQDGFYQHNLYDLKGNLLQRFLTEGSSIRSKKFGDFTSYFPNGQIKMEGQFSTGEKTGLWKLFYESGKIKEEGEFENNLKIGVWKRYYENGQLEYTFIELYSMEGQYIERIFENAWDKTGKQTLTDQTGWVKFFNEEEKYSEEGKLKIGQKEGTWIGTYENGQKFYEEEYEADSLIRGVSWDKDNKSYKYTDLKIEAYPEMGYKKFYKKFYNRFQSKYLTKNIFNNSYTYAETLYVAFDIGLDGTISNITVLNPQLPSINNAAVNTLQELENWVPPIIRGQTVASTHIFPVELYSSDEY
ncbi:hypothetical protein [Flammeovirga sp. EKP202]|uniref:hypothetical protein n=1 Tax=Flammeovirga sp. EKP202 TaxID=2770592 RepID=UPI00165F5CD6|nr:hypothetical protein [Flammeovirga sp. EKP202]MBD0403426.1 hypothetical protein [Flammeovirga sp. EKP202]